MKGQIFIIISIIVLIVLIMIKMETSLRGEYYKDGLEEDFENIKNEYEETIEISLFQKQSPYNIETNMNNFSSFIINKYEQKNYTIKTLYSFAFVNSSDIIVVIGNFLGKTIRNVSLNVSNENDFISVILNKDSIQRRFDPIDNFNITLTYFLNEQKQEFVYTSDNTITVASYIDIYIGNGNYLNDKLIFNKTLSE